jgi:hypothetical protein
MGNPVGFCFFLFFPGRKGNGSSFLFRRKEAKENHLRNVYFPLLLTVSPTCSAKRTAHIRAGRFFVSSWMCAKTPSVRNAPLSRFVFCFFSSRKEIVPLLFFLEEKKQKKIICRICFCAFLCILRNPVAQNGWLTYEPAVFSLQAGCAGKRLLSEKPPQPLCLLFLFFKKRNRSPSFLFRRKEAKENQQSDWFLRFSLHFAQSCCTKRMAHIRAGRFFVSSWMYAKSPSVRKAPSAATSFVSFLQEKKSSPKRNRTHFSCA